MNKTDDNETILAIDRLILFVRAIDVSHKEFEQNIGVPNGYISIQLKRRGSISSEILNKILLKYPELNVTWLLTGHKLIIPRNRLINQSQDTAPLF